MSRLSIAAYFPFRRVKISGQSVMGDVAVIEVEPDRRFTPICRECGRPARRVHSRQVRAVRDLNLASTRVTLRCLYRKVYCQRCQYIIVEDLEFFGPYQRLTMRLARYIHALCKVLTVKDVSDHLGLNWKTVKNIDKAFLEREYGKTDYRGLRILAVDEMAIRKGHQYMTVVLDYQTGRVVWMGEGRSSETLKAFFSGMTEEQKQGLEAIAMDMWDPYIRAVQEEVPHVKMVFDLFHVVSAFNKVIDRVRIDEYKKASKEDRKVLKGSKYLLLKNSSSLRNHEQEHLQELLALNSTISLVLILRDKLKTIWEYKYRQWAEKALDEWCSLAQAVGHPEVTRFARRLKRYAHGILNHCHYPIHTSRLEGVINKIKVIKRKAYGYHDNRYLTLKVKQAFAKENHQLIWR